MSLSLQRLKHIDKEHKILVYGFMREAQSIVTEIIPELITVTCLLFYFNDFLWDYSTDKSCMKVINDGKTMLYHHSARGFRIGYSKFWIQFGTKYVIKIKVDRVIDSLRSYWGIIIGITSNIEEPESQIDRMGHFVKSKNDYAYESNARIYDPQWIGKNDDDRDKIGTGFNTGDILTIIVNNDELQYEVNGKLQWKIKVKNTDLKYKLAVSMTRKHASITFV